MALRMHAPTARDSGNATLKQPPNVNAPDGDHGCFESIFIIATDDQDRAEPSTVVDVCVWDAVASEEVESLGLPACNRRTVGSATGNSIHVSITLGLRGLFKHLKISTLAQTVEDRVYHSHLESWQNKVRFKLQKEETPLKQSHL